MLEQARAKLQAEIDASRNDDYIAWVGQHLLAHLETNPQDAEKFLTDGKTIAKSMDAVKAEAQKNKKGNAGFVNPDKGRDIILGYFGIKAKSPAVNVAVPSATPTPAPASDFDISLDAYL